MKYIDQSEDGAWRFDAYFERLAEIEMRTPDHLLDLIHNRDRYWINSPRSFHDSWLENLTILGSRQNGDEGPYRVEACFLGPMHDRLFKLTYSAVEGFTMNLVPKPLQIEDDLLVHEFDIIEDGIMEHRQLFASGLEIYVACRELGFEEELIPKLE